jgi:hypothetical protein
MGHVVGECMNRRRRSTGYIRIAAALATFAAACVLALVAAYWGWQLFGPKPIHVMAPQPTDPAATILGAHLFGTASDDKRVAPAAGGTLPADARLLGIIATPDDRGYALFRLPAGPVLVAEGQEIAQGVRIVSIAPDAITVRDASGERRYDLRDAANARTGSAKGASPASSGARVASADVRGTPATNRTCAPPSDFRGNVVRLNTELLAGLTGDSGPWTSLLASAEGGLVVRDGNGFGALLGLQAGDRIAQANGIALRAPDDVAAAVVRPLVANQGVHIVGSRAGTRQELWLANIACAG